MSVKYVAALDGIRAIAVFFVFLRHSTVKMYVPDGVGVVGVGIFFALSGFLITSLLLEETERTGAVRLRSFYVRRAYRLLPALFFMLLGVTISAAVLGRRPEF